MRTVVKRRGGAEDVWADCFARVRDDTDELEIVDRPSGTVIETISEMTWESVTIDNGG